MVHLILTADYEIFGNGSGDVRCCLINPTNRLLDLCGKYGAKLTLFFDVCEYWAFRQAKAEGKLNHLDYDPAAEMAHQAQEAVRRGHDVQLHLHPQWLNAEIEGGHWKVDFSLWRTPALEDKHIVRTFRKGKQTLEDLLRSIDPLYRCVAFRAGALSIQPEDKVLAAMKEVGLYADSSVAPGLKKNDGLEFYDFYNVPDKPLWRISHSVAEEDPGGTLWEIPIATKYVHFWERDFGTTLWRMLKKIPRFPEGCYGSLPKIKKSQKRFIKNLNIMDYLKPKLTMLDISSTERTFSIFVKSAINRESKTRVYPLVATGHPKCLVDAFGLRRFLQRSRKRNMEKLFCFNTLRELIKLLDNR